MDVEISHHRRSFQWMANNYHKIITFSSLNDPFQSTTSPTKANIWKLNIPGAFNLYKYIFYNKAIHTDTNDMGKY